MNSCAKLLQELTAGTHDEVLAALSTCPGWDMVQVRQGPGTGRPGGPFLCGDFYP